MGPPPRPILLPAPVATSPHNKHPACFGGTGGTRTPVLVTGLVYSQMRSPLRHSPTWGFEPLRERPRVLPRLSYPTQPPERNIPRV